MDDSVHGDGYMNRWEFIIKRMEFSKCPRGRDLSPNQRHCGICSRAISDTSAIAKICPQSDGHVFHWLCMLQWLSTWNDGQFCRSCPMCRTELYQLYPESWEIQPSEEAERLRMKILDAWEEVLRHHMCIVHIDRFDFIERRLQKSEVDRVTPLKLAMHGHAKRAIFMGFLADPEAVEIQRSGAYMTDKESHLRNILETLRSLLELIVFPDEPTEGSS